jgi:RNA polymerase sigma factor (sigma-70 family)
MASTASSSVARQIESLFEGGSLAALSDRQLLDRFNAQRDAAGESAFAALVVRHGPMVLGVCTALVGDRHHAEDAFQAVFLILAQKARSIGDPDLLGNWLYGVALRTARCARIRLARRCKIEETGAIANAGASVAVPSAEEVFLAHEQAELLHDEIGRLPRAFRQAVVLCYLEDVTVYEAARRLRCSHGTVRSRMARAREKLRRGLIRRGVVLTAAALTTALVNRRALASVSTHLSDTTSRAAIRFVVGQSTATLATAVAREVLRSMLMSKVRLALLWVLVLAGGALGVSYLTAALARNQEPASTPIDRQTRAAARASDRVPPAGRMFVVGRVLDPTGKEVAGVPVEIIGRPREPWVPTKPVVGQHRLLGSGVSANDGRFSLLASRTSTERFFEVYALARAPGLGLGWTQLNASAAEPTAEIRLQAEQLIHGRLFDVHGQPASAVEVQIWSVGRPTNVGMFDGVNLGLARAPDGLRNWPAPVNTDEQGRFTLAGIGHDLTVGLLIRDRRFANQSFRIQTDNRDGPKELSLTLQPATIIDGRILARDTGQPIGGAELQGLSGTRVSADEQGHYSANVTPAAGYRVEVFPTEGQPYLAIREEFKCPKGTVKLTRDIKLPRGVVVHGKVIEQGSGRPLAGASLQWMAARTGAGVIDGWQAVIATKEDGSYQIAVAPGKGYLFVYGPTSDFVLESIGGRVIYEGKPGGERYYAHAIVPYEVKPGDSTNEVNCELRQGKLVKGHLIGPAGQAIEKAEIIALLHFNYFHLNWRGDLTIHAREGAFELHGVDPDKATRVSFLDADHQWGATVELSGKRSGEDVRIQLLPCGQATARFVSADGKPIPRISPRLEILGSTGPDKWNRTAEAQEKLAADAAGVINFDRKHYWNGRLSDAEGRITLPDLIPGATYRINDWSTMNDENKGVRIRKEFSVKPGENLDLGDILIEKSAR